MTTWLPRFPFLSIIMDQFFITKDPLVYTCHAAVLMYKTHIHRFSVSAHKTPKFHSLELFTTMWNCFLSDLSNVNSSYPNLSPIMHPIPRLYRLSDTFFVLGVKIIVLKIYETIHHNFPLKAASLYTSTCNPCWSKIANIFMLQHCQVSNLRIWHMTFDNFNLTYSWSHLLLKYSYITFLRQLMVALLCQVDTQIWKTTFLIHLVMKYYIRKHFVSWKN